MRHVVDAAAVGRRLKCLPGLARPEHPQDFDITGDCVKTGVGTDAIDDTMPFGRKLSSPRMGAEREQAGMINEPLDRRPYSLHTTLGARTRSRLGKPSHRDVQSRRACTVYFTVRGNSG